jgi:hypothetical protein
MVTCWSRAPNIRSTTVTERKDENERRIVGSANSNIRNTKEGEKEEIFPDA